MTQAYTDEWFKEMGKRIKARDHANEMVTRWLTKVADAEAAIAALAVGTMKTETEQEQE